VEAKELEKHAIDAIDGIIQKFTHTSECITFDNHSRQQAGMSWHYFYGREYGNRLWILSRTVGRASIVIYILKSAEFFRVFCIFLNEERSKNDGTRIFWEPQKMRTRWYIISFFGNYIIFILSALMCDM
jgi:hypothetical protein